MWKQIRRVDSVGGERQIGPDHVERCETTLRQKKSSEGTVEMKRNWREERLVRDGGGTVTSRYT